MKIIAGVCCLPVSPLRKAFIHTSCLFFAHAFNGLFNHHSTPSTRDWRDTGIGNGDALVNQAGPYPWHCHLGPSNSA